MAEQTFQSPGFFEREIDLAERKQTPTGTPAGIIGTAQRGPAFIPVTVGDMADFITRFGDLDSTKFGPYAVNEFLKNRQSLTYLRVLGAGANADTEDFAHTAKTGQVKNAGFVVTSSLIGPNSYLFGKGQVVFIAGTHNATNNEAFGLPVFTDNAATLSDANDMKLLRAQVALASDTRLLITASARTFAPRDVTDDSPGLGNYAAIPGATGEFKLILSSAAGSAFATTEGYAGIKILTASLNPTSASYIANVLNTDPEKFGTEKHFLMADYAVDDEMATVSDVAVLTGSSNASAASGDTGMSFADMFGHFNTRYVAPKTPSFISQPYGTKEFDLFTVESIDDGAYSNSRYKISISNLKASGDPTDEFGTFTLQVRSFDDTDTNRQVLEEFIGCSLNPRSERFVAKLIGDIKTIFDHDAELEEERRIVITGKYPNRSRYIRVIMSTAHENGEVPDSALPFGFRGVKVLKTNDSLTDTPVGTRKTRLQLPNIEAGTSTALSGSVIPPIPFRFKVTRNNVATSGPAGNPGTNEIASSDFYWGVKFERNTDPLNSNVNTSPNRLIKTITQFAGIEKLDALVTGSSADSFCHNKFTLANVALRNTAVTDLTASVGEHMREACYLRDGGVTVDAKDYRLDDGTISNRISMATLLAQTSSFDFNKFVDYNKFTTVMYGGFDGLNILDKNSVRMNDRGTSIEAGGAAASTYTPTGLGYNPNGAGTGNNNIASYKTALNIMTDPWAVNVNILSVPGIREPLVTDHAADRAKEYGKALYVMDLPQYDESTTRLFDDRKVKPDVEKTEKEFDNRSVDNNYVATYFPDVQIDDERNNKRVTVPPSVAAVAALGFNDRIAFPWFAPAGFNRAALNFVKNTDVRLASGDRDTLYDTRINPIASFPREGFVIWGQKTLQLSKSALDRINVRRTLLEIKRIISGIALSLVFEPNNAITRSNFTKQATLQLGIIQAAAGVESFSVIMDESNNTDADVNANRMNGRIVVVPTRAVEFIAIDFIITPAGVEFA